MQLYQFLKSWAARDGYVPLSDFRIFLGKLIPELQNGHKDFWKYDKEIEVIITSSNFNTNKKQKDIWLSRFEFVETMVRLCRFKYIKNGSFKKYQPALKQMFEDI